MDKLSPERRSANMKKIGSKNTSPELGLRRLLHALGYRFRVNCGALAGKPDVVFTKRRKVIFLNGCFWHLHHDCREGRIPETRRDYWEPKLRANQARDARNQQQLIQEGWRVLVVWECELHDHFLADRLKDFLGPVRC